MRRITIDCTFLIRWREDLGAQRQPWEQYSGKADLRLEYTVEPLISTAFRFMAKLPLIGGGGKLGVY